MDNKKVSKDKTKSNKENSMNSKMNKSMYN